MVDIAVGYFKGDPLVVLDVIGLIASFVADVVGWDSLWGRKPPIDYNFEESILYLNYDQSFKF